MWSRLLRIISDKEKNSSSDASIFSSKRKITIIILSSVLPVIISLALIIIIVALPLLFVKQYMKDALAESPILYEKINNILVLNGWCTDNDQNCNKEGTQKYYDKLDEIYNKYKNNGVEIDVELITATIFYSNTQRPDLFQEPEEETSEITEGKIKLGDIDKLASNMVSGRSIDYTKYRNYLIDTYIPKRFKELYEGQVDEKETIEQIADEIMAFASGKITVTNLAYNSTYASCSQVTINNHGNIEIHELEEYVAGVTTKENGGGGPEALKIQAILARSFAVKNCNNIIEVSENDQDYTQYASDAAKEATEATKGQILTYNGEILETISFASYPRAYYRGGFPAYEEQGYLCGAVTCNNESDGRQWCTTTLYKQPAMEKYELKMPNTSINGNYWNGMSLTNQKGHCYGVSQVATLYYESELNYTYDKMINEFLSPGVEVNMMQNFMTGSIGSTYISNVPMYETASTFYSNVNYDYYLSTSTMPDPENYGECPWYAQGRALEIVANSNMPEERKQQVLALLKATRVDGGLWYSKLQNSILSGSTDIYAAKPGSIVTWASAGNYGHVGIVEDVEYDSNGRASRVLITESWNGTRNPANASYSYSWQTIDAIRYYTSLGHGFVGYTYLLD